MSSIENGTWAFMVAGDQTKNIGFPKNFWDKKREFRRRLAKEEWEELQKAEAENDLVGIMDACADLIVVLLGTMFTYVGRVIATEILDEVSRSNLSKIHNGKVIKDAFGKIMKGPGFFAPRIKQILELGLQ